MVKKKLFVGNLPNNYDSQKLRDSFEQFGTVAECDVLRNYGFVHMENEMEAEAAVRGLHHTMIDDCQINVQYSTTEVHKNPGVGSKGECFRCGKTGHFSRECPTNANGGGRPRGRGRGRGRGGGGGRGDSYSNGRDFYPSPMRDGYYEFDDYYRRPLPPPGYGYRERSRSPPMRRPVTPPGYRRRYSPTREYYDRYYERIPSRDPYYSYERRNGCTTILRSLRLLLQQTIPSSHKLPETPAT
ncbi:RNA-binding protein 4.1-like isoform X2 [Anneissia japonica]|uniref:RNA-binding protein 4.1-like isoform X2 n=1 Tax=Anneissia japonica TaxID=1529436 RepID=UPI0014258752|nr:RNA-binding protein 4.1-like isoform X2 [Anneissia japonica]